MSPFARRLQHMLQNRVIALSQQQKGLNQFGPTMIRKRFRSRFQGGQDVSPL